MGRTGTTCLCVAILVGAGSSGRAAAQGLSAELRRGDAVPARVTFPARPGVCGTGDGILVREPDGTTMFMTGNGSTWGNGWREGEPPCEPGDVVAVLERSGDAITRVRLGVGRVAAASGGRDLGRVSGQTAVDFLLEEAGHADPKVAERLVLAAWLAGDAVAWPGLLELARDRSLPSRTRRSALQWLGREAAAEAVEALGGFVRDRTETDEIREAAVFGLSRLSDDQAVPRLIDVVRTVDDARVRSRALFWLADFDDPRAIALFEEILTGG